MASAETDESVSALLVHDFEREKLAIERDKLAVEREKLIVEKYKARWSAIGIAVPLLVVAATVALGLWSQYQKARDDFALKAAEILMAGEPSLTNYKAAALRSLFPNQLPKDFAKSFDPDQFGGNPGAPSQMGLVHLMAARPENATKILAIWKSMFPADDWVREFEKNLASNQQNAADAQSVGASKGPARNAAQ